VNSEMLWSEFLALAREEAGSRVVETWFQALSLYMWDVPSRNVYIHAPNAFVRDWVSTHFNSLLSRLFSRLLHLNDIKIIIIIRDEKNSSLTTESLDIVPAIRTATRTIIPTRKRISSSISSLQATYRFDTFIVGSHNALAYAAAHAIAEQPGSVYNPLFVYGKSGSGKTHLLHAIGNSIRERRKDARIVYQSANRFVAEFIHAIRFDRIQQFEAQYKHIDVLLMDDMQFLANKEQTQEAFFHLFNILHHEQRQIVCTCDSLPGNIVGCADRVRSRLASGLVADISEPTLETKMTIIKRKAEQQGVHIDDTIINYIAQEGGSNIRDTEGTLIRIFAHAALKKSRVTAQLVRDLLNQSQHQTKSGIDMARVTTITTRYFNCSLESLRAHDRTKAVARARHITMFLMKRLTKHSLREIGAYLHHRDHSTVLHALHKIELLYQHDYDTRKLINMLEQQIIGL
jgi:chromosomal replication initiator protein